MPRGLREGGWTASDHERAGARLRRQEDHRRWLRITRPPHVVRAAAEPDAPPWAQLRLQGDPLGSIAPQIRRPRARPGDRGRCAAPRAGSTCRSRARPLARTAARARHALPDAAETLDRERRHQRGGSPEPTRPAAPRGVRLRSFPSATGEVSRARQVWPDTPGSPGRGAWRQRPLPHGATDREDAADGAVLGPRP